jgi:tetratricopeptide (TPR) repeat protein
VWCPWSVTWLSVKAFSSHESKKYDKALWYYSKIIDAKPDNSWAYRNRSLVYYYLGEMNKSADDYNKARALDPSIKEDRIWEDWSMEYLPK